MGWLGIGESDVEVWQVINLKRRLKKKIASFQGRKFQGKKKKIFKAAVALRASILAAPFLSESIIVRDNIEINTQNKSLVSSGRPAKTSSWEGLVKPKRCNSATETCFPFIYMINVVLWLMIEEGRLTFFANFSDPR